MKRAPPTSDPDDDLTRSFDEIEKLLKVLAGDNAKVSRSWLHRLRRLKSMLNRPLSKKARQIAREVGRIALRELMAEIAKRLIETFIRNIPAFSGGSIAYDGRYRNSNLTRVRWAHTKRARDARQYFPFVSLAA
ncbi:MAG TPA: hypothetical protein VK747_20585 [Blastocatellia bacterium]|nr:hypothetical protein [Blastocatellia bacterium]